MKTFYIQFYNIANPSHVFLVPVLADSLDDAHRKARDYPYTTDWVAPCQTQGDKS